MTHDHERVRPGADLIDGALEASVLGSFSRIGFLARRSLGLFGPLERIDGRCCWITGASSGLGLTAARELARLGARVRLVVRDAERGAEAKTRIERESGAPDVRVELCDISSLASVRALATRILERDDPVHVLIHNAGVLPHERRETADGIELTFATNVLGPYLLTELLHERLRASAPARVLFVTSGGMYSERLAVDDLQSQEGRFRGPAVYARTKRAEVAICQEWAETLQGSGIVVHAMHPGWSDSPGIRDALPGFSRAIGPILRTPEQGVDTLVWLASAAQAAATSGLLWLDRRPRPIYRLSRTRDSRVERRFLLAECARLAGLESPALAADGVAAVG
jgi:NAD(P)-dependent dehydrogenase (short-subunit alcohol dehydrogenase family)